MEATPNRHARLVLPPGQEGTIQQMLDVPAGLGGGWRFERATIAEDSIDAYYRGPVGERARIILRRCDDAPSGWKRTTQFALGLSADPPGEMALALYRSILAKVRRTEGQLAWRETALSTDAPPAAEAGPTSRPGNGHHGRGADPDYARRARAAEHELDMHLDYKPYVELEVDFDHTGALAEAMALSDRFVAYQSDPTYGVTGWRGLALQALDGDATRVATTDEDAGVYRDQSRYRLTDVAALCPITMALLERLLDFEHCRTVSFLRLEPGAGITVHVDGEGPPVIRSVNVALNMPEDCRLVIDCNADGSDNPYTRTVPFREGSVFLLNVAKYHYVVNDSDVPRIHVVARGSLRQPVLELLARAEAQDGLVGAAAVDAALRTKRRALGEQDAGAAEDSSSEAAPPAEDAIMSPFVGTLADATTARLVSALDLGDRVLAARAGSAGEAAADWRIEVDVRLPSGNVTCLELQAASPARPAWFRTPHLACSYRATGDDPLADARNADFFRGLRQRLAELDPPGSPPPELAALFEALDRYRPYLPVQDKDYRIVFRGSATPVGILWLGFRCNQDCRMCWQGRDWPAPPDEVIDRWIDELLAGGIANLILSGGEPTLHPRLAEWLRRVAAAGAYATLETNAIRFTEPDFLAELCDAGLKSAVVSLHSSEPDISDALTMTPGSFARTVAGTTAALAAGVDVGVHCVVERHNVGGLEAHARFVADQLGTGERRISHVSYSFPIGYRRTELYGDAIVALDELRPQLSVAVRLLRERGIHVSFLGTSGFTPCAYDDPASLLALLPEVVTAAMREGRTFVQACAGCSLRSRCLGLHEAYVTRHGERGVEPIG